MDKVKNFIDLNCCEKGSQFSFDACNLENKYGVVSECIKDSKSDIKCLYLQDLYMKDVFNFFPDRLCIDVTHKCMTADIFMYLFLCEDSNGRNEIVAVGFTTSDNSESFLWLLNTFKKNNPNWRKIKILTLDPEIKYKDVVRNVFPAPYIIICFHHALKSFSKGVESIRLQNMIPNDQIKCAIDLFKSMYNSVSHAEYEICYQQFIMLHSCLVFYFQEVWLPSQHLWRIGLDFFHENLFSSLNCHLEVLDNTMKVIFVSEDNLMKFIEKFFVVLSIKRAEKSSPLTNPLLYSRFSTEYQMSKILTPYAARFVVDQYGLSSEIHMDCSILSDSYFFDNFGTAVNASVSMCQCNFFLYFFLPCRHIFAVRKTLNLCAFDENLVDSTWNIKYYQSSLMSIQSTLNGMNNLVSKHILAQNLLEVSLLSLYEDSQMSESRSQLLNELAKLWTNNEEVYIQFEGVESFLPEVRRHSLLIDDHISQKFKIEDSFSVDTNKSTLRKALVSSKSFKVEYANPVFSGSSESSIMFRNPMPFENDLKQRKWNFKSKILDGNHINYAYLCRIICDSKETILDWLRQMELICTSMLCPTCGYGMTLKLVPRLSDGAVWVCSNDMDKKQNCSRRCSVRRGSWFELTNMSFEQILSFCYMWINNYNQSQIVSETGISTATYISWNKLNRRVCEECLIEDTSYSCKMDISGYAQVLETWLEKLGNEDSFLKFLQDANAMHRKDSAKHSVW